MVLRTITGLFRMTYSRLGFSHYHSELADEQRHRFGHLCVAVTEVGGDISWLTPIFSGGQLTKYKSMILR